MLGLIRALPVLLVPVLGAVAAGCQCRPELPPDDTDDETDETDETDDTEETGDTSLPARCAFPELEPDNNLLATANLLPMEQDGCGEFHEPLDFDYWTFSLQRDSWISIRVDAQALGSYADVAVTVLSPMAVGREYGDATNDVTLTFPGIAGDYEVLVSERNAQGAEDTYFYDVLATQVKEPVSWNRTEVEPNNTDDDAMTVVSGDVVFGTSGTQSDRDRYAILVPAGKHTLIVDVDAFEYGSPLNPAVLLYRADGTLLPEGCSSCEFTTGPQGWQNDPFVEYNAEGDEVIFVQITELGGRSGSAWWYTASFTLEGDP